MKKCSFFRGKWTVIGQRYDASVRRVWTGMKIFLLAVNNNLILRFKLFQIKYFKFQFTFLHIERLCLEYA